jgi:hypothetical protein
MYYEDTDKEVIFEPTEVSKMEWKSFDDCIASIRSYNLEKIQLITNINNTLLNYAMIRT